MIIGIGVDIVEIKRMERWTENKNLLERFFHNDEISLASSRRNNEAQTFASRFAAKEAFGKALGTGLSNIALKDIAVINSENGKPQIKLYGTAQNEFNKSGATKVHISISHEKENAIAMIILEKE